LTLARASLLAAVLVPCLIAISLAAVDLERDIATRLEEPAPVELATLDLTGCQDLDAADRGGCIAETANARATALLEAATARGLVLEAACRQSALATGQSCSVQAIGQHTALIGDAVVQTALELVAGCHETAPLWDCVASAAPELAANAETADVALAAQALVTSCGAQQDPAFARCLVANGRVVADVVAANQLQRRLVALHPGAS
jgi:hypothetical protein